MGTKKVDLKAEYQSAQTWKGGDWIGKGGVHLISVCHVMCGKIIQPQEYVQLIYTNKWMLERMVKGLAIKPKDLCLVSSIHVKNWA